MKNSSKHLISFLIVNYKTEEMVCELIKSIKNYIKKYKYEILIFDNSYSKNSIINSVQDSNVQVFNVEKNIGFVKANNILFQNSKGDIVVLLNSDTLLINDSLEKIFDFLVMNGNLGIVGPKLLNADLTYQESFYRFPTLITTICELIFLSKKAYDYKFDINEIQDVDVIKGACIIFNREILKDESPFDESFEMYSEEVDLCFRVKKKGYKNIYYPFSQVIHFGGVSSNYDDKTIFYTNYNYYKSKRLFFKKHKSKYQFFLYDLIIFCSLIERVFIFFIIFRFSKSAFFLKILMKIYFHE